jgi:N-sulfoglucosamine sulfohydrolase
MSPSLKITVSTFALLALLGSAAQASPTPPNIVFLFADDWGRLASIYADLEGPGTFNDAARTPHIDAVARRGVLFRHAFVSAPSCTPCRSALLSGQDFFRTGQGAILQGAIWDPEIPSYPLLLQDAGYHIGHTYKVWSPGSPRDAPHGGQARAFTAAGGRFNSFSQHVTRRIAQGISADTAKSELYAEVRGNLSQFLDARPAGAPFTYWFGPTNVHRKWVKGSGNALWDIDPDTLEGKMPPFLPDLHAVREDLADYLGEIAAFDAGVGVILEQLEQRGVLDHSLIVISGDHGPPGFPYGKCNLYDFGSAVPLIIAGPGVAGGRVIDDLVSLTDLAPTFLQAAGLPAPEAMTGQSLWPLLASEAEGQIDPARDAVLIGRERHVARAREGFLPYPQRALRTRDHLYIINFKPDRWPLGDPFLLGTPNEPSVETLENDTFPTLADEDAGPTKAWLVANRDNPEVRPYFDRAYAKRPREELYDLATDPHQLNNLAADPAHAELRATLETRLLLLLKQRADPRLIDDGSYFETPPLSGQPQD